ncbi:MAG TPA: acetylornithine transaminase [Syntrophales bacterium]|nr:acetylornithine transaminase [Syntrophales bacterium]HOX95167.1 acetylornithine transaminase [Syntrophales bacterium]HPI57895.1 acetylornithine transaminase [Syntrophales bacterium]HPN24553.1 acetylornithine transaminase [Syntrophales bacterium]HQM28859.1 acetylornithine transaminase [Syntrophales bacterium]
MQTKEFMDQANKVIIGTYRRQPVVLVRGSGARVWDSDGREYLDFVAGIAVCSLGHSNPKVVAALRQQAELLTHVSNLYYTVPQIHLAGMLVENSFADKVFFCNSGAEANEAAIKLARKYAHDNLKGDRYEIITMRGSFHGRTLAAITATAQEKFHVGFAPLPEGFRYVPFNDVKALEKAIRKRTCAVMVEPIQGESGVQMPSPGYLEGVRRVCDDQGILLILDEVQTGMGRTGKLFAHEHFGITPDIMTLAKALGNGYPLGALLATDRVASAFGPGTHASTFGGNPLGMAAGIAVLRALLEDGILDNSLEVGAYLRERLGELKKKHFMIQEVRGMGLMVGMDLTIDGASIVQRCLEKGLLINCAGEHILRFVPPLTISQDDVDRAVSILDEALEG